MSSYVFDAVQRHGISYAAYVEAWRDLVYEPVGGEDKEARKRQHYVRYNWERSRRVHDQYQPSEALRSAVASVEEPQVWMLITENWCGDSAFVTPVIAEAAGLSEWIDLKIILRDTYPDIMDAYLTNGGRSIPKLVAFSQDGQELFQYGPRPQGAIEFRKKLIDEGKESGEIIAALVNWYEQGGWNEVDAELATILNR